VNKKFIHFSVANLQESSFYFLGEMLL